MSENILTTNIFICTTSFQIYIAEKIITSFFQTNYTNILITSVLPSNNHVFDEIIILSSGIKRLLDMRKAKKYLDRIISDPSDTIIFIPHVFSILSNYIFFHLKSKCLFLKINFYYEGLGFLYQLRRNPLFLGSIQRYFIAKMVGINYKIVLNEIIPLYSAKISYIYTPFPEHTFGDRSKFIKINIDKIRYNKVERRCLILGQKLLDKQHMKILYAHMLDDIQSNCYIEIFYKKHPSENASIFEYIARQKKIKFINISSHLPIEKIFLQFKPSVVFSFYSSGLINLKAMYEDVEIKCYLPDIRSGDIEYTKVRDIFENFSIEVIQVPVIR